jgi:ferredoxin-NAD(P)+ reductase (naphthalene dioxygenase ferredoxin-specific)
MRGVETQTLRVLVRPMNRLIKVAPGANLLQALLDAKVPVSHSCMAGRCGTCRCRAFGGEVLEYGGEATRPLHGDRDFVLACQTYLTEPCTIEIPEADEVVVHPARIAKGSVVSVSALTHDVMRLVIRPNRAIQYSPGQYLSVDFGPSLVRPYSMATLCTEGDCEFHVRVVPNGRVSGHIANHLRIGDSVKLTGPLGTSYLRLKHTGPILCVAGGTGLAPILAIIRGAIVEGLRNPIRLYFGVRSPADIYGLRWLEELRRAHPSLDLQVVCASGGDPRKQRTGLVTTAIESDTPRLEGWCAYVCGSPPMVEAVTLLIKHLGIEPARVYADAYYPQDP